MDPSARPGVDVRSAIAAARAEAEDRYGWRTALAKKLGIRPETLTRIENGRPPSPATVAAFARLEQSGGDMEPDEDKRSDVDLAMDGLRNIIRSENVSASTKIEAIRELREWSESRTRGRL